MQRRAAFKHINLNSQAIFDIAGTACSAGTVSWRVQSGGDADWSSTVTHLKKRLVVHSILMLLQKSSDLVCATLNSALQGRWWIHINKWWPLKAKPWGSLLIWPPRWMSPRPKWIKGQLLYDVMPYQLRFWCDYTVCWHHCVLCFKTKKTPSWARYQTGKAFIRILFCIGVSEPCD